MGQIILHKDGAYQVYSTISDGPLFERALTLEELTEYIHQEFGNAGLRTFPDQLARARRTGCSGYLAGSLEDCIRFNRAGEGKMTLSLEEFTARYLTLTKGEASNGK